MQKENFAVEGHALPFRRMMFEITRRCNLCCAHCFRGDPQNVDISEEIIDRSLDQISSCFSFDVTGVSRSWFRTNWNIWWTVSSRGK